MKSILVTGANGFVGQRLVQALDQAGCSVRCAVRDNKLVNSSDARQSIVVGDINENTEWATSLAGVDTVVHLAARVHVMNDDSVDPLREFRSVNVEGTVKLAGKAADAGVRRLIYLSSIKVNGEQTGYEDRAVFMENDLAEPCDPYAISKHEAEVQLREIERDSNLEVVIIRPPLVYGPGVKANFYKLLSWVNKGIPLPLLSIKNNRSMVSVFNLVDLIKTCIDHPQAAGETFLVSDGDDLSTAELIQHIAKAMDKPARLFSLPEWVLNSVGKVTGKSEELRRLCGSLQVDISKAERVLGWAPSVSVDEGIRRTVEWFMGRDK